MNVVMASGDFKEAIGAAHAIIPTKSMANGARVIIEAQSDGTVWISGRTEEMSIKRRIQAKKVKKAGILVLSAARTEKIAQVITADEVTLTSQGVAGVLKAGKATFKLPGLPAEELLSEVEIQYIEAWDIQAKDLKFMTEHTAFAVDKESGRPVLEGVLLEQSPKETRLVATDGRQLAKTWRERGQEHTETVQLLIPAKAILATSKHFGADEIIHMGHHEQRWVGFRQENVSLTVRLIEGPYPNYERVIPKESEEEKRAVINRSQFVDALKHMSAVAPPGNHRVRVSFDLITTLSVKESGGGEAEMELAIKYEGEPLSIDFDVEYLIGVVNIVGGQSVRLRLTTPNRAVIIEPEAATNEVRMLALVMPLRPEDES